MKRKLTVILSLMILFIAIFTFMPVAHAASNPFPWGWCTWYAWQRAYDKWGTDVPVRGNAKTWHTEAKNANWPVDSTPKSDSIAVWTSGYYGHVAYVEKVEGSIIYISEMNFNGGFGVVSEGYFDTSTGMWQGTSNDNLNYERAFPEYYIHITSTVTFNANGGTGAPGNLTKVAGLMPNIPTAKPTRAGYSFLKWNNSADGNGPNSLNPGDQWGGDVDITFYAIWKAETGSEMKSGYSRTISNGDYLIVPTDHSDYFLDIYGTDKPAKNGTKVTLWSLDRNNVYESDIWTVSYSNGFYTIKQKGTNRYLDVEKNNGSELKTGTKIQVWEGTNIASNQQWAISKNGNGYRLQARCSGMSLDVSGGSFQNDVKIQQYDGNDTSAQRWTFLPYKNGKVVFPNNNSGGNTQPAVPAAPQTNVSFSFEDTNQMYFMSETTAQFGYIIVSTNGNINDVKTSGCELADSRGNILATHEEPSYYKNGKILHYFRINGDPKESDICYTLSPGTNYKFRSYVIYNGKKYYSSWRDFKTNGVAATPVPVTAEFSFEDTDQMYFMNDTTAQFGYIIVTANVNINDVKTSGCELADASGNILAAHEEPSYYKNGKILHYFRINGDPNESDICYALSPGTSYKFRSYVIYNGKKYYSGWRDFKTTGSAAPASSKEISFSFEDTNQMYFMNETTAQFGYIIVTANVNINDVKISGCELADKDGNLLATHEEPSYYKNGKILHYFRINGDPNESDICYTLSPGTSYKFRSYVIYNGQKYYSGWRDFTTTGTPPGTVVAEVPEDEMGPIIDTMPEGDLPVDNSTPDVNPTEDDSTSDAIPIAEDSAPDADPTADNSTPDTEPTTDNSAPHTDLTADDSTPDTDLTTDGSTPDTDPTTDVPTPDFSKKKNPARFLKDDGNVSYHAAHLYLHIGSKNCKVSTDYVKVRKEIGSNTLVGHLEQADTFTLDAVNGNWAKITVTRPAKTSPDSREGMTGWVDADYMECPCSYDEYYSGNAHLVYSIGAAVKNGVNLRELPSKESTLFAALKKGERAEILSEYAGKDQKIWYRCRYEGKMGFIRSDMLEIIERDLPEGVARDPSETEGKENQTENVPGKPDSSDESETTEQQEPLSSSGSDSGLISEDSYYESDNYNTDEVSRYIPLDVYADRQVYHAGETITFGADILGGVPPFSVHWVVEESQTRDGDSPLDQYINTHPEYVNSTTYATNDRHVEFSYTAPVDSLTLYGMVGITDANGIGSYRMDEDLAGVCSIREWNEMYPNTDPVNISLPFVAKTNMDNVPVWDGVWDGSSVFAAIGTKGTSVRVVDRFSDTAGEIWYKVRLNVRQAGYVKAEHLEIPQPAVAG